MKDDKRYCQYCYCLKDQCMEVVYGAEIMYYFRKVTLDEGLDFKKTDSSGEELAGEDIINQDFTRILNQLQFANAVINGIDLNEHKLEGSAGYETKPLPKCIADGSYNSLCCG